MLPCQRSAFDIPRDIAYFNAAGWSPLPLAVQEAGRAGVGLKGRPWLLDDAFPGRRHERARAAAASLIHAEPADVALIPSVGYGVASAGRFLPIPGGSRVLVLADDHSSPVLEWVGRAPHQGFIVETVARPVDGDWTGAVLEAVERPGASPLALASISSVHWSDGGAIDLARVAPAVRHAGGLLLVDFTHGAGILDLDVRAIDPDVVIFPTYKWLLGPYGRAFMYVARRHQSGVPLEQTSFGRRTVRADDDVYFADLRYVDGAKRYDMGERDHFVSMEMAAVGIETLAGWGRAAVRERLGHLTELIEDQVAGWPGVDIAERRHRAPHIICLGLAPGRAKEVTPRLAARGVHVAARLGRLRISPHVYNDEEDVARLRTTLGSVIG